MDLSSQSTKTESPRAALWRFPAGSGRKPDTLSRVQERCTSAHLQSERQLDFLHPCGTLRVNVAELAPLGPIEATRWAKVGGPEY
jgi:hypothetical protein